MAPVREEGSMRRATHLPTWEQEADADAECMNRERRKLDFFTQVTGESDLSEASTTPSLEALASPEFLMHQCKEIDAMTSRVVGEASIRDVIRSVVAGGQFCVSIADPRQDDVPLIAVSEQFEQLTGYSRAEMVGKNCRVLNDGCFVDTADLMRLRAACTSGASFTGVLANRRKSGEGFLNLLDLRGLTVARNPRTGEELWFLVGIQADVTNTHLPPHADEEQLANVHAVASSIRAKLKDELSAMAVAGALASNFGVKGPDGDGANMLDQVSAATEQQQHPEVEACSWCLLPTPLWRCGEAAAHGSAPPASPQARGGQRQCSPPGLLPDDGRQLVQRGGRSWRLLLALGALSSLGAAGLVALSRRPTGRAC